MRGICIWVLACASMIFVLTGSISLVLGHPPLYPMDDTKFAPVQPGTLTATLEEVATGLTAPMAGAIAPGLPDLLFVPDQNGILWAINIRTRAKRVFLDVRNRLVKLGVLGPNSFDERGLLSVAFHPDFARNGLLYTYTTEPSRGMPTFPSTLPSGTAPDHDNVVAEWRVPNPRSTTPTVDPASRRELLRIAWPQFNHNGGAMAFGPDGMLYISTGDGGGADDRDGQLFIDPRVGRDVPIVGHGLDGNGLKLTVPLGKILRINPLGRTSRNRQYGVPADNPFVRMGGGVLPEIWAYGFRNPWRMTFDRLTGDLYVGDVGQNDLEEVNWVVRGGNYGWPIKEGTMFFHHNGDQPGFASPTPPAGARIPTDILDPVLQYDTHHEGHAVIGGYVYRGRRIPQLAGVYIFGDYTAVFDRLTPPIPSGRLFYAILRKAGGGVVRELKVDRPNGILGLTVFGFGEDANGEVYLMANGQGVPFGTTGVVARLATVR